MAHRPVFVRPVTTNPGMWLSLAVPVAMVVTLSQNFDPNAIATWEAVFAAANWGAILGMPLVAAAVAISVRVPSRWMRTNRAAANRSLGVRTLVDIAPTLISIVTGYLLSLVIVLMRSTPASGPALRSFGPVGVFVSIVLVAVLIGFVAGRLLPAPVAVVTAALVQYTAISIPLVSEHLENLRFSLGYSLPLVLQTVDQQISSPLILLPMVLGGVVVFALVLASAGWRWLAGAWVVAATAIVLVLGNPVTAGIELPGYEARSVTGLHCDERDGITVCVWPEFLDRHHDGVALVDSLAATMKSLAANGVDVGALITTSSAQAEDESALMFAAAPEEVDGTELPISIASGARGLHSCAAAAQGDLVAEGDRATYALAIALGVSPDLLAQRSQAGGSAEISGQELLDELGISTATEGFAIFAQWQRQVIDVCGKGEK